MVSLVNLWSEVITLRGQILVNRTGDDTLPCVMLRVMLHFVLRVMLHFVLRLLLRLVLCLVCVCVCLVCVFGVAR